MELEIAAKQLESLGNATRLGIYRVISLQGTEAVAVGDIQKRLGIPASTLSHHLGKLVQAGLVIQQRSSRTLLCKINPAGMHELIDFMWQNCGCEAASRPDCG